MCKRVCILRLLLYLEQCLCEKLSLFTFHSSPPPCTCRIVAVRTRLARASARLCVGAFSACTAVGSAQVVARELPHTAVVALVRAVLHSVLAYRAVGALGRIAVREIPCVVVCCVLVQAEESCCVATLYSILIFARRRDLLLDYKAFERPDSRTCVLCLGMQCLTAYHFLARTSPTHSRTSRTGVACRGIHGGMLARGAALTLRGSCTRELPCRWCECVCVCMCSCMCMCVHNEMTGWGGGGKYEVTQN